MNKSLKIGDLVVRTSTISLIIKEDNVNNTFITLFFQNGFYENGFCYNSDKSIIQKVKK